MREVREALSCEDVAQAYRGSQSSVFLNAAAFWEIPVASFGGLGMR